MKESIFKKIELSIRLKAMALHFLITLIVAGIAASLVFWLWFPYPFNQMLGGLELFSLVIACDIILGPLISLVIYNRKKPRKLLLRDYAIVGLIQLTALSYGLHMVTATRPAFVVLAVDRLEVISAGELNTQDLQQASQPEWQNLSWTGPRFVWAESPTNQQDRNELLFSGLVGKDLAYLPRYYRDYSEGKAQLLSRAQPLDVLYQNHPQARTLIDEAVAASGKKPAQLRWLPVRHIRGFWTVLVNADSALPVAWLELDPY